MEKKPTLQRISRSLRTLLVSIVPVVVFICAAIQAEPVAVAKSPSRSQVYPAWPAEKEASDEIQSPSDTIHLRTVVLYPKDRTQSGSVSAELVFLRDKKEHLVSYDNRYYPIAPIGDSADYDSAVVIDGISFCFRLRLRPYER